MTLSREETELPNEAPPVVKPRLSSVILLSMALGALLALFSVFAYSWSQRIAALQSEVAVARDALNQKSRAVEDMRDQIEALSRQVNVLKEYSVARSAADRTRKAEAVAPAAGVEAARSEKPGAGSATTTKAMKATGISKTLNEANCDLVGKSAVEQEATMKRCVELNSAGGNKK